MLVIALCLWLPLQAIAGQWQHCAQIQASLDTDKLAVDKKEIQTPKQQLKKHSAAAKEIPPCHQLANTENTTAVDQSGINNLQNNPIQSCKHCQFVCHWHSVILTSGAVTYANDVIPYYIPFKNPSPAQPLLLQPQRPPQIII